MSDLNESRLGAQANVGRKCPLAMAATAHNATVATAAPEAKAEPAAMSSNDAAFYAMGQTGGGRSRF